MTNEQEIKILETFLTNMGINNVSIQEFKHYNVSPKLGISEQIRATFNPETCTILTEPEDETDGVILKFTANPNSIPNIEHIATSLMYGDHFTFHPEYGGEPIDDLKQELASKTCWHYRQITITPINTNQSEYQIIQGLCTCS